MKKNQFNDHLNNSLFLMIISLIYFTAKMNKKLLKKGDEKRCISQVTYHYQDSSCKRYTNDAK